MSFDNEGLTESVLILSPNFHIIHPQENEPKEKNIIISRLSPTFVGFLMFVEVLLTFLLFYVILFTQGFCQSML